MSEPKSAAGFKAMAVLFKIRDLIRPPHAKLMETGLSAGQSVLDFGCGPGSFAVEAARITGDSGRVFALDVSPHAIASVRRAAGDAGMKNIVPILSDCASGLDDRSIDVVLLYDIYHDLDDPCCVLDEITRVLKPEGIVSFSDHHMKEADIVREMTAPGRFVLSGKGDRTYSFKRPAAGKDKSAAVKG